MRHCAFQCTAGDIGNVFPELIWHTETPVLRTAPAPLMLLSRHVHSQGFKVVMTGEGAEEVFGGYDLFKEGKIRRFWTRQPESAWRPLLFSQGDRVSLAHSVEGRVAYLDHRVIEFVNALSPRYKLRGLHDKVLLCRVLGRDVPQAILRRGKQPYRAPDSRCFFQGGRPLPFVAELMSPSNVRRTGYFRPEAVERLLEKCRIGRAMGAGDNMAFVGVPSTLLLHEQFFAGRAAQVSPMSA